MAGLYGLAITSGASVDPFTSAAIPKGDLALDADGALDFTDGAAQARQEAECRLDFFLGEYFLDTRQGIPYFRDILVHNPSRDAVRSVFRHAVESVPGLKVKRLEYMIDGLVRLLKIDWEAVFTPDAAFVSSTGLEVIV